MFKDMEATCTQICIQPSSCECLSLSLAQFWSSGTADYCDGSKETDQGTVPKNFLRENQKWKKSTRRSRLRHKVWMSQEVVDPGTFLGWTSFLWAPQPTADSSSKQSKYSAANQSLAKKEQKWEGKGSCAGASLGPVVGPGPGGFCFPFIPLSLPLCLIPSLLFSFFLQF